MPDLMKSTKVFSLRLPQAKAQRLSRLARRLGRTVSETGAMLVDEGLRRADFSFIDFRDSTLGRQAYVQGSSLAVWEVCALAEQYGGDLKKTAEHLEWTQLKVQAAVNYAKAFPDDIKALIEENEEFGFDRISDLLPQAEVFRTPRRR